MFFKAFSLNINMEVCYNFFFATRLAEPKVCFLQTVNAEPIPIVVTPSLVFSPKLHPLSSNVTINYSLSLLRTSFILFGFLLIIYSNLFCVYLLSATV